jgi:hypothetical protein
MWTITNSSHYPVYMMNSPLNTNKNFDYSEFLQLGTEMKSQQGYNDAGTTVFVHSFSTEGTYVFADADGAEKLMVI